MTDQFLAIQASLIEATGKDREVMMVDGCVLLLNPNDPLSYLNYAVPLSNEAAKDIDAIADAFKSRGRTPRFEFNESLWPAVSERLLAAGFQVEARMPIMITTPEEWRPRTAPHGIEIQFCTESDAGLLSGITSAAFSDSDEATLDEPKSDYRAAIASNRWIAALGYIDGQLAGGGVGVGDKNIREAAGIGVIPRMRKRGLGGAITAAISEKHFSEGGNLIWLTPGDERAKAVYSRLGFRDVAQQVCLVGH